MKKGGYQLDHSSAQQAEALNSSSLKKALPLSLLCAVFSLTAHSETAVPAAPDWQGWHVANMDDASTTREYNNFVADPITGLTVPKVHRITEVATGLNYFDKESRQWRESQDLIELTPDGGAAGVHGSMKAYFKPDLASGITLITKQDRVFVTRPVGIYYFNPDTGESVELAPLNESAVGELHPPNQIIWKSAFNSASVQADLRVTYTHYGFESDVIYTRKPKPPETWAPTIDPNTAQLQVRHIWLNCPDPKKTYQRPLKDDQFDEILDFGDLWFPTGSAFSEDGKQLANGKSPARIDLAKTEEDGPSLKVSKRWQRIGEKDVILTESVSWKDAQSHLTRLPETAAIRVKPSTTALAVNDGATSNPKRITREKGVIQLAAAPYRASGFVVDYIIVPPSGSFAFIPSSTYYVSACSSFAGTVTFYRESIIKYANWVYMAMSGPINSGLANYPGGQPQTILTSADEDIYGECIPGSTGNPTYAASSALSVYGNTTLRAFKIRWARTAVRVCANTTVTLTESSVQWCQTGASFFAPSSQIYIDQSTKCSLGQDVSGPGSKTGDFTDMCTGDNDPGGPDGLPDSWEYRYFGTLNYSGYQDCDGDGSNNLAEYNAGSHPLLPYPAFTTVPEYQIVHVGATVTFPVQATPTGVNYTLERISTNVIVDTTWPLTVDNAQPSDSDIYKITISAPSLLSSYVQTKYTLVRLVVLNEYGYYSWQTFTSTTNGKTGNMWTDGTRTAWNPNSIINGKGGFTAISQVNNIAPGSENGQIPITALTRRHGYTRGHDTGIPYGSSGYHNNWVGKTVTFRRANNEAYVATIAQAFTRCMLVDGVTMDYTIVIFDNDLPTDITPMSVVQSPGPGYEGVVFRTCQHGIVTVNQPPFAVSDASKPPFSEHDSVIDGDSGSPDMLVTPSGALIS